MEGGELAGYDNIKDKGFDKRSTEELREIQSKGGKKSGETRRKQALFRKSLNQILSLEIDSEEWTPFLKQMGLDCTFETALHMAMVKEALAGNTKAYELIAKYTGQSTKSDIEVTNLEADVALKEARKQEITGENETDDALNKLDAILEEVKNNAFKQETE